MWRSSNRHLICHLQAPSYCILLGWNASTLWMGGVHVLIMAVIEARSSSPYVLLNQTSFQEVAVKNWATHCCYPDLKSHLGTSAATTFFFMTAASDWFWLLNHGTRHEPAVFMLIMNQNQRDRREFHALLQLLLTITTSTQPDESCD